MKSTIPKPIERSRLRKILGREYYILKRYWFWLTSDHRWAKREPLGLFQNEIFRHKSIIKRQLANVDMQLQENKKTNLEIAASMLDGVVLRPGETFSFWKLVGRPTSKKGYLKGLVLNNGHIDEDVGGGLCQFGNLIFWIAAHSSLDIIQRYRHGFDVFPDVKRDVPFGAGATLAFNHIDLMIKNKEENSFQFHFKIEGGYLHGYLTSLKPEYCSFKIVEREHLIKQQIWGGYTRHNKIIKIKTENDCSSEELLVENHAIMMYSPLIESSKKKG